MSSKTTGPESTNPSAVTGVLRCAVAAVAGRGILPPFAGSLPRGFCADGWSGCSPQSDTITSTQAKCLRYCAREALSGFDRIDSLDSLLYDKSGNWGSDRKYACHRIAIARETGSILQLALSTRNSGAARPSATAGCMHPGVRPRSPVGQEAPVCLHPACLLKPHSPER